ncbi:MAG: tetratricopeptide repeat protein, partial [Acidobacteriota bacterium]
IDSHAGKFQEAADLLQQTVKLQPDNAMAWYMLGQSLQQTSQTTMAMAAWRQAIAIDPNFSQALFSLARALRSSNPSESGQWMARYLAVQKQQRIQDRADTLANDGVEAESAHDWPAAIRLLNEAIAACGDCAVKADLHRKLGIIECEAGHLDSGKRELLAAQALKPDDAITRAALELVTQARMQNSASATGKRH